MKWICMLCLQMLLATGVSLSQNPVLTHDVKGTVVDHSGQPVVGALVYVEGMELSTVTDVEGNFLLRGVPVSVEKLTVEAIGMSRKKIRIDQPVLISSRHAGKRISFVLSAGIGANRFTVKGGSALLAYELGMGMEVRISKKWAFRPMIQFSRRGTEYRSSNGSNSYIETWKLSVVDMPLLYVNRHEVMHNGSVVLFFGPVISAGIGGKVVALKNENEVFSGDPFSSYDGRNGRIDRLLHPFQFGAMYGLGFEYKKCMVGFYGKNMCLSYSRSYNYTDFTFDAGEHSWMTGVEVSYRF